MKAVPDPAVFTTLKNVVAVAILVALAAAVVRPAEVRRIGQTDRLTLAVIGILGGGVAFLLFFTGLAMASAPSAAFIHKTMVIWVAMMAGPFLGERLGLAPILALGVLIAGQALILPPLGISWGIGETLIALATLIWAVEVVLAKRVLGRVRSPIVGVARLGHRPRRARRVPILTGRVAGIAALDGGGWTWVAVTGLLLAGYVGTWLAALRRAPASEVTSVLVVGAVITAALTAITRGTLPEPVASTGYALVLMAVGALILDRSASDRGRGRGIGPAMIGALPFKPVPEHPAGTRPAASGPVLFARYAYGPNRFGYCGPDDADELLEAGAAGQDTVLRALAQRFEGAYPYLALIDVSWSARSPRSTCRRSLLARESTSCGRCHRAPSAHPSMNASGHASRRPTGAGSP